MNHDFYNKALDACVEYRKQLTEKDNEVARLRDKLKISNNLDEHKAIRIYELENEVARLRELLERLCDSVAENWDEGIANYFREEANKTHNQ